MNNEQFSFVLFDLDQTLCDRRVATCKLAEMLYHSDASHPKKISLNAAVREFLRLDKNGYEPNKLRLFQELEKSWGGLNRSPQELADWLKVAPRTWYKPDPKITEFIAGIMRREVRWGIVTNGTQTQFDKARRVGAFDGNSCFIVSEVVGFEKPEPDIFEMALQQLAPPSSDNVLFVGDNPVADIDGARKAGMHTAWVRDGQQWPKNLQSPDYTIDSVIECDVMLGN